MLILLHRLYGRYIIKCHHFDREIGIVRDLFDLVEKGIKIWSRNSINFSDEVGW